MHAKAITGVFAALLTPRLPTGRLNEAGFESLLRFIDSQELDGVVLNGATGEFCLTTPFEFDRLLTLTRKVLGPDKHFLCGIGSTSLQASSYMAHVAADHGAAAVLVPPPYFFPYSSEDVATFLACVAENCPLPVLLYNLPQFTSPIGRESALHLIDSHSNIIGIKDSSGSLNILQSLSSLHPHACRLVGNDGALVEAKQAGLCDGVISGIAGVFPELIKSIFYNDPDADGRTAQLAQLLERIDPYPTPWALKWIAEARGVMPAHFAQPLSAARKQQGEQLKSWFRDWSGLPELPR